MITIMPNMTRNKFFLDLWCYFFGAMLVVALFVSFSSAGPLTPEPVNLQTAGDFVLLAKTGISASGSTSIVGDIGVSPVSATYVTGFGLIADISITFSISSFVTGKIFAADYTDPTPAKMITAVSDMETAYTDAAGRTLPDYTELYTGDVTGQTLTPGVYKWSTGVLVSDGGVTIAGNSSDVWIFQVAENLELGNGAIVTLSGGAQVSNIFWQVAGQVTLGTTSEMKGILLCQTAIVMSTGATLNGRALAQTAITLDANTVISPVIDVAVRNSRIPQKRAFFRNNSNEFIEFSVPSNGRVTLITLTVLGQKVATLFDGESEAGELNRVRFNGNGLAKGLYLAKLEFDGERIIKKIIVR